MHPLRVESILIALFISPKLSPTDLKAKHWKSVFSVKHFWVEESSVGLGPLSHSLGRTFAIVIILLFVGHPPRGMDPDYIATLPLLPFLL